ncbi:MAG: phosphatase PAP2 family protein [Planctomycetaceae bacterium]|nr:phosphatase PAP2 family protein [Planctomycetaceae bacterium]
MFIPYAKKVAFTLFCIFPFLFFSVGLCAQTPSCASVTLSQAFLQSGNKERDRIFADYGNLYNCNNVKNFGLALMGGAVLANTKLDRNFANWYSSNIHSDCSDEIAKGAKIFGEGHIFIPVMAATALTYRFSQEKWGLSECKLGGFADRTMRGYLVGAPTLLVAQAVLGGDRPRCGDSYWTPFQHCHGVSGHAFMGAVPFITAAQMTDKPCVKGLLYALSALPAWSRVNDEAHYLSQVLMGWYLAYLSVRAVSQTESKHPLPRGLTLFPVCGDGSVGMGLLYQR